MTGVIYCLMVVIICGIIVIRKTKLEQQLDVVMLMFIMCFASMVIGVIMKGIVNP